MSELSFRLSREGDIPALQRLWSEVFGDGEELTGEFFRLLWRPEYCRVAEDGGKIAAMGFCIPGATARGARCSYIYAMATAERYRGLGAAQKIGLGLIADAFASGADLVATLPAEDSLCRWYESRTALSQGRRGRRVPGKLARICRRLRRARGGHARHDLGRSPPRF